MSKIFYQNDCVELYHADPFEILDDLDLQFDCCISNYEKNILSVGKKLRQNGKCIIFSGEPDTSLLRQTKDPSMYFNYAMVWVKNRCTGMVNYKQAPVSSFEDISVFQKKYDFSQINMRIYSKKVYEYIGKSRKEIYQELGNTGADHFFRYSSLQFQLPTKETYEKLVDVFHIDQMNGFLDFDNLEKEQSIFNSCGEVKSNVLFFDRDKEHCGNMQKPVALIEDLIKTYTNVGDWVLDVSAGAGTLGIACMNTNRKCVLIEKDKEMCEQIKQRCEKHLDFKPTYLF